MQPSTPWNPMLDKKTKSNFKSHFISSVFIYRSRDFGEIPLPIQHFQLDLQIFTSSFLVSGSPKIKRGASSLEFRTRYRKLVGVWRDIENIFLLEWLS
jgi:hypothetical protein